MNDSIVPCRVNPKKLVSIQRKMEAHLASDFELKESAQRAFQSYLKSTYLLKNKAVFDVFKLNTDEFAKSLGLAFPPRVRFLQRQLKMKQQQSAGKKGPVQPEQPDAVEELKAASEVASSSVKFLDASSEGGVIQMSFSNIL